ncbi:Membrane alanyl aminopeptidase Metallo peptidase. MEROPS family M01 [Duganella sp. CF458]|uniref:aminopeptidase N n=1 Tax=Duganella sp. CF458 TaxID=1884368 RepID=UPI0008F11E1A|nr:aminopeptidase N [Duganella sp. CF458]SFG20205.1 Membrane alanyl aminopeptidase Metallo peptidase. MEROPS family M01 [Duganella sp. CF458]
MKSLVPHAITLAVSALVATSAIAADNSVATPRAENPYLSQVDAAARSARVSNVAYVLDFTLTGQESFSNTTTVSFDLKDNAQPLTLDLDKATVKRLVVNGKQVAAPQYNNWFITLAAADLKAGRNSVTVDFERKHSTNGEGLHRMVDPVDGRVYTYSHFEPAAAHQMFALFDQPDLKATYQVNVTAPADWTVVSTARESKVEDAANGKRWTFPVSKILSPYNFSLHAGPYKVWEDATSAKYPMRLFARQSVADQVDPAPWFEYTRQGLAWFDDYFGIPYQYGKYDQLLVPDFLYGAMENAGAVTFAEHSFLHKDKMSSAEKHDLASVIMHEMAHQWFGDLVTMQWWNGLWLNESFASFMGTLATAEATEFKDSAWQYFYAQGKSAAYVMDQRVTTHPIETPVPSTANAFDNIDAITYSKGASTLKQLRHLLGEETFRKGVHNYLVKYQWKNAKLDDFIGSLAEAAGRDLGQWTQDWLYQPGVNTITANYSCKAGKIDAFSLQQSAVAQFPTLREQRVQLALMQKKGKQLAIAKVLPVTYKGANTEVAELKGAACPDLVYPNYQDWGFVKAKLDTRSFATARQDVSKVEDKLLRTMLWHSMWDNVRDGALPLNEFLDTVLVNAPQEKDYVLLGDVLGKMGQSIRYLRTMSSDGAYTRTVVGRLEKMAWSQAKASKGDFQRRWFTAYLGTAGSKESLERIAALLDGREKLAGLTLSQDVRWDMIAVLNRKDYPGAEARIAAEQAKDKSDSGELAAVAAQAARPDAKVKQEWLARIGDTQTKLPFSRIRTAMHALYPSSQVALNEQSAAARLAQLPQLDKAAGPVFMRDYAGAMIPATCTAASVQRLADTADANPGLSAGTRRSLLVAHQEDQRCVAIRKALTVKLN